MTTLQDHIRRQFPRHAVEPWGPRVHDTRLSDHTLVAYSVGTMSGSTLLEAMRQAALPGTRIAALEVVGSRPTVLPSPDEDRNGDVDVPRRRVLVSIIVGAVLGAGLLFLIMGLADEPAASTVIGTIFGALAGGAAGTILGSGRFAGQRATLQPRAPGNSVIVVAAFLDDERSANALAHALERRADHDIRIVDQRGGWHSPDTYAGSNAPDSERLHH